MQTPTFYQDGSPTEATLATITNWPMADNGSWSDLVEYCKSAWNTQYGKIEESPNSKGRLVSFITGGWSDNEAILGAMCGNRLFYLSCWQSSAPSGLVRFTV
ncbi:hypothetical protein [Ferrovum sp.]|uniref:hypothetical protein n=1 Tax=Ferrovum sp. TaxID=2609467 RepID=UPI0026327494|nr:hypothetical protein [Ferrovum sp.]